MVTNKGELSPSIAHLHTKHNLSLILLILGSIAMVGYVNDSQRKWDFDPLKPSVSWPDCWENLASFRLSIEAGSV